VTAKCIIFQDFSRALEKNGQFSRKSRAWIFILQFSRFSRFSSTATNPVNIEGTFLNGYSWNLYHKYDMPFEKNAIYICLQDVYLCVSANGVLGLRLVFWINIFYLLN
jgi:hypothetical protein